MKIVLCITGQLARLELASKFDNFIVPNLEFGRSFEVISSLYSGVIRHVNIVNGTEIFSPHYDTESSNLFNDRGKFGQLEALHWNESIWSTLHDENFRNIDEYIVKVGTTTSGSTSHNYFSFHLDLLDSSREGFLEVDYDFAVKGDKFKTNTSAQLMRTQMHLNQWYGLHRCATIINAIELSKDVKFDIIIKFRDDSFIVKKFYMFRLDKFYTKSKESKMVTLHCMNANNKGIHDNFYILDRERGGCIMSAFIEFYFLQRNLLRSIRLVSPERLIPTFLKKCGLSYIGMSICSLPIISMDYLKSNESGSTKGKYSIRSGISSKRDRFFCSGSLCSNKSKSSTCFKKSDEVVGIDSCPEIERNVLNHVL
jgi:hypothetical protein